MNTLQPEADPPWAEMTRINFLLFTVSLIAIDQLSKYIVRHSGGFYICNPGIAFGVQIPEVLFWTVYAIIIGLAIYLFLKPRYIIPAYLPRRQTGRTGRHNTRYLLHNTFYIILILSGAFSNLLDRLRYGCVIDFIDLKFWPVFNLADTFITIGGIILVLCWAKEMRKS